MRGEAPTTGRTFCLHRSLEPGLPETPVFICDADDTPVNCLIDLVETLAIDATDWLEGLEPRETDWARCRISGRVGRCSWCGPLGDAWARTVSALRFDASARSDPPHPSHRQWKTAWRYADALLLSLRNLARTRVYQARAAT